MKFVLLTRDGYEHRYVANKLASQCSLAAIVVDLGKPRSAWSRLRCFVKRYTFGQLCTRLIGRMLSVLRADKRRQREQMFRVLGKDMCERHQYADLVRFVHGINGDESCALIGQLNPDVILVYGTSVVSDRVLSLARKEALNMHTGMSPYYRGAGCAFWPLYNDEPEMLGATIHECTSQIDGGMIYAVSQAHLEADDDVFSVFARCVKVGADLYVKVVQDMAGDRLQGVRQQLDQGREYKAAMKNFWHDLKVRRKIKKGLVREYARRTQQARSADDDAAEKHAEPDLQNR